MAADSIHSLNRNRPDTSRAVIVGLLSWGCKAERSSTEFRLETGVSRRDFLAGGISLGAFALPAVLELSRAASPQDNAPIRRRAKSVIVLQDVTVRSFMKGLLQSLTAKACVLLKHTPYDERVE